MSLVIFPVFGRIHNEATLFASFLVAAVYCLLAIRDALFQFFGSDVSNLVAFMPSIFKVLILPIVNEFLQFSQYR